MVLGWRAVAGVLLAVTTAVVASVPGGVAPAHADGSSDLVMPWRGPVTVTVLSRDAAAQQQLAVGSPVEVPVCDDCYGGETADLGVLEVGDTVLFVYLGQWTTEASATLLSTSVRGTVQTWVVGFEDSFDADYNDLVIEVTSRSTPGAPLGGALTSRELAGGGNPSMRNCPICLRADPVNTMDGSLTESSVDLAVPSRTGLALERTYSSVLAGQAGDFGFGWSSVFGARLDLTDAPGAVTFVQENGSEVVFTEDGSGGYAAAPRIQASLEADPDGTFTVVRQQQETFEFAADGTWLSRRDRNGDGITLGRDATGRLETVESTDGRSLTFTWTGDHVTAVSDDAGREVEYGYSAAGDLTSVQAVDGAVTGLGYDESHRLISVIDPVQHASADPLPIRHRYNARGQVVRQTDQLGRVTSFSYRGDPTSAEGGTTLMTDPSGHQTLDRFQYGERASTVLGVGTPQAVTETFVYDPITAGVAFWSRTAEDSDAEFRGSAVFDPATGLQTRSTDGAGRTTTTTYDEFGQPLTVTSPNPGTVGPASVTTTYEYDERGNLVSESRPLYRTKSKFTTLTTSFRYTDPAHPGDLTEAEDPAGAVTRYAYDASGNPASVTTPEGRVTSTEHDARGNPTATVSPRGNAGAGPASRFTTTRTFDDAGRVLTETVPSGAQVLRTTNTYDENGRLASTTDGEDRTTTFVHDAAGQAVRTVRPDGSVVRSTYWPDGLLATREDAAGHVTSYAENALDQVASRTDPLGRTTTYGYVASGQLASVRYPSGRTTRNVYTPAGDLIRSTFNDGRTAPLRYGYNRAGLRTSMSDGTGPTTWTFDSLGRQTAQTTPQGTTRHEYDAVGRVTALTYASGHRLEQGYDDDGNLTSVTDWLGNTSTFEYDAGGQLSRTVAGNGVTTAHTYDDPGRLVGQTFRGPGGVPIAELGYRRNRANQLTKETATSWRAGGAYGYDALGRLASNRGDRFRYDDADNLTTLGAGTLTYDAASQVQTLARGASTATYGHDTRGQRTGATGAVKATYGFDQRGMLTTAEVGPRASRRVAGYTYDGTGLRSTKTVDGVTSAFTYDTLAEVPALLSDGTLEFVYGPGGVPIEQVGADGATYLHTDQLGSVRALTAADGTQVGTASYSAYGSRTVSGLGSPLGYTGQYTDDETGFVYLRARYLDPTTGQFVSADPMVDQTGQPYEYAANDPVNTSDPLGLFCTSAHCILKDVAVAGSIIELGAIAVGAGLAVTGVGAIPGAVVATVGGVAGAVSTAATCADAAFFGGSWLDCGASVALGGSLAGLKYGARNAPKFIDPAARALSTIFGIVRPTPAGFPRPTTPGGSCPAVPAPKPQPMPKPPYASPQPTIGFSFPTTVPRTS